MDSNAEALRRVSSVTGTIRIGYDALHALQACLNVGTLTGAPKIRATELLRGFEKTKRGPYGGAIGPPEEPPCLWRLLRLCSVLRCDRLGKISRTRTVLRALKRSKRSLIT